MQRRRPQLWLALIALFCVVAGAVVLVQPAASPVGQGRLHDNEVGRLFDRPQPGLSQRRAIPAATGNSRADARIRDIALGRGYQLHGEPLDPMGTYQGRQLQQRAIDDLVALQTAMLAEAGVTLTLTSAYRGATRQRGLFIGQLHSSSFSLRGRAVTNNEIGLGLADDVVDHAMRIAAPPGFSRHHTGLTIDVASGGLARFQFANSTAYDWLTQNRYANAMAYGWIPSYPPRASGQGPNPEPWEWVWIGRDAAECAQQQTCALGNVDTVGSHIVGWAVDAKTAPPRALRLQTSDGTAPLVSAAVPRFDIALAYGLDDDQVGFDTTQSLPKDSKWACVEARSEPGGPWNPIGCLALAN